MAETAKGEDYRGLDVGTSRIVLAKPNGERPTYNAQLNAFISLPYSKMTEAMLNDEGIYHRVDSKEILAFGNRVDEFANMLGGDTRRPMQTGLLNAGEPKSKAMMALALEEMCGKARKNAKICFSVPSAPPESDSELIFHEHVIKEVLEGLGYRAEAVNEGMAIIYAELAENDLTGIGMSFGGGLCNVSVAYSRSAGALVLHDSRRGLYRPGGRQSDRTNPDDRASSQGKQRISHRSERRQRHRSSTHRLPPGCHQSCGRSPAKGAEQQPATAAFINVETATDRFRRWYRHGQRLRVRTQESAPEG